MICFFFLGVGGTWDMFRCVLYSQALNFESNRFSVSFESSGQQCFSRSDGWNYKVRSKIIWRSCQRYPSEILLSCFSQLLYRLCRVAEINQFLDTWYFATFLSIPPPGLHVSHFWSTFFIPIPWNPLPIQIRPQGCAKLRFGYELSPVALMALLGAAGAFRTTPWSDALDSVRWVRWVRGELVEGGAAPGQPAQPKDTAVSPSLSLLLVNPCQSPIPCCHLQIESQIFRNRALFWASLLLMNFEA